MQCNWLTLRKTGLGIGEGDNTNQIVKRESSIVNVIHTSRLNKKFHNHCYLFNSLND
jgi:hypothetical protein